MKTLERYQKINYGPPDVNARSIQEELVSHFYLFLVYINQYA